MGKNRKGSAKNKDLGRMLIKDKNNGRQRNTTTVGGDSWHHTSDVQDGYDWNRLNLQSVTEQDTLDEFLDTAGMAGADFTAEKLNINIVRPGGSTTGVLGEAERERLRNLQEEHKNLITIPKRPLWDASTTPEELEQKEKDSFLTWRRSLALLQEKNQLLLTPYEKNLDVWRQLWRVIERSDVICQIVDARNPLLYICDDLETYVNEVDSAKEFIVLVNKADYLSEEQRICWVEYFTDQKKKVIFFSALDELIPDDSTVGMDDDIEKSGIYNIRNNNSEEWNIEKSDSEELSSCEDEDNDDDASNFSEVVTNSEIPDTHKDKSKEPLVKENKDELMENTSPVLSRSELLRYFGTFKKERSGKRSAVIGLVGYPNVGKSSTINALIQEKKTAVSSTPGKTKHFQTHFIDDELCLCDCPGLVFPSFVFTKPHLILNGILPVDQLRDHIGPVNLLATYIPKKIIESTYGINIVVDDPDRLPTAEERLPTAEEILSSYAKMRGYMTSSGQPDCPRAARYVVKDFLKGKLLHCHPPPGQYGEHFVQSQVSSKVLERLMAKEEKEKIQLGKKINDFKMSSIDEDFFSDKSINAHYKVPNGGGGIAVNPNDPNQIHKPWKKHHNRNKKEKLRRIHDEC